MEQHGDSKQTLMNRTVSGFHDSTSYSSSKSIRAIQNPLCFRTHLRMIPSLQNIKHRNSKTPFLIQYYTLRVFHSASAALVSLPNSLLKLCGYANSPVPPTVSPARSAGVQKRRIKTDKLNGFVFEKVKAGQVDFRVGSIRRSPDSHLLSLLPAAVFLS